MHVIILDGNRLRQQWYAEALAGHVISFVDTALDGVRMAQVIPTGAIVAEYFEDNGPELLKELERLVRNCRFLAPPVFLTGEIRNLEASEKAVAMAIGHGARDFIARPVSRERFREIVTQSKLQAIPADMSGKERVVTMRITRVQSPPHSPRSWPSSR
jgi:response regulator RpfG family c-di-GMP phosphodiesterase